MFENFDFEDPKEVERLFSYLDQEKFDSLSLSEQDEVIDTLISLSSKAEEGQNVHTRGFIKGSKGITNFNVQKIIDEVGYEPFREVMRTAISKGGLKVGTLHMDEIKDLCERAENGTLTDEEEKLLKSLISFRPHINDPEDVQFSAYTVSHLYYGFVERTKDSKDINALKDAQPFINAAFTNLLAAFIGNKDNAISSMFDKQGLDKVLVSLNDLTIKFANMIIEYSKDNDIAPERTTMALMNVVKILAEPLNTSLDCYPDDKIDDIVGNMLVTVSDENAEDKMDDLKSTSNDSTTKSANADKKESQDDNDIRKLLLDD